MLNQMFTSDIPIGAQFKKIEEVTLSFSYLDEIVDQMIRQEPRQRPSVAEIKEHPIARQQQFVSLQKIHELTKQVVPEASVPDPLAIDPIHPTNFDYEDGQLIVELSRSPNPLWIQLFQNQATQQFVGMGPNVTRFYGARAVVPVTRNVVVEQKGYVQGWIRNANGLYQAEITRRMESEKRGENRPYNEK